MDTHRSEKTDFSDDYLEARQAVDKLCRNIVLGVITAEKAVESYGRIEAQYARNKPADLEFFRRIYRNRVVRLIDQFKGGKEQ